MKQVGSFVLGGFLASALAAYLHVYVWHNLDSKFAESRDLAFQLTFAAAVFQLLIGSIFFTIGSVLIARFAKKSTAGMHHWLIPAASGAIYLFITFFVSNTNFLWLFLIIVPVLLAFLLQFFSRDRNGPQQEVESSQS